MQAHPASADTTGTERKILRAGEICTIIQGIGRSTLLRMARSGQVPYYRVGRTGVRFDLAEVRQALRRPARTEEAL